MASFSLFVIPFRKINISSKRKTTSTTKVPDPFRYTTLHRVIHPIPTHYIPPLSSPLSRGRARALYCNPSVVSVRRYTYTSRCRPVLFSGRRARRTQGSREKESRAHALAAAAARVCQRVTVGILRESATHRLYYSCFHIIRRQDNPQGIYLIR